MKVSTYIAQFFKAKKIDTVFELQGGMITRILDEMFKQGGFKIVSMHHEQAAAFAADAYARITNKPGVALATSGPGATNLITGIGSCFFDSVPAIFITGQVNISEQKGDKNTRQIGFQETDIVEIVKSITKASFSVKSANDIPAILEKAYALSLEGRPGPVLIDIPMNIQQEEIDPLQSPLKEVISENALINENELPAYIEKLLEALRKSKKPLVLAGRGIRAGQSSKEFIDFIEKFNLPVVTSLLGFDTIPYHHPNRFGFIGTYGNRWSNYALGNCDLLIALGSRIDLRQTGSNVEMFQSNKKVFHVDIDPAELNNRLQECEVFRADVRNFLTHILKYKTVPLDIEDWFLEVRNRKESRPDTKELENIKGINPNEFIHALSGKLSNIKAVISDVGNNQMWTAQSLELNTGQLYVTSGGMGAMGYALPAAIGASFALKNSPVVLVTGDGGFQVNIQELQTVKRNNLPIKMVILNNRCLGMIRQFQDAYFDSCYQSTVWGYSSPDFAEVAKAYGVDSKTIDQPGQIDEALNFLFRNPGEPSLLNVIIDTHTNAFPKMLYGMPITKMEPFIY